MKFLKEVYLSNWYGFVNEYLAFDKYGSFITGENESGKSTILDAIKYAFMGDTQFNKGAEAKGAERRTLASYTRCLYNPSEKLYHRKEDDVFSHIFLCFEDDGISTLGSPVITKSEPVTIGCIIHTNKNNNTDTDWYKIDTDLRNIAFNHEVNGKRFALVGKDFTDVNSEIANVTHYPSASSASRDFMYTLGLQMTDFEIDKYREEMRRMLAYNSKNKIVDFIKDYVLKPNNVNIDRLRESKKDFDSVKREMDKLMAEFTGLTAIREAFNKYTQALQRLTINEHKTLLHYVNMSKKDLTILEGTLSQAKKEKDIFDRKLEEAKANIITINQEILQLKRALDGRAEPIEEMNNHLLALNNKKEMLKKAVARISTLYGKLDTLAAKHVISYSLLEADWTDRDVDTYDKEASLDAVRDELQRKLSEAMGKLSKATIRKNECMDAITELNHDINDLKNNTIRAPEDAKKLVNAINAEFARRGIKSKATFAAESVIEIVDEDWRDAIEACVGPDRYNVLVDKDYYQIAYDVQGRLQLRNARLVNVRKLFERDYRVAEDSVFNLLQIENKTAKKYFQFRLGNVIACDNPDNVDRYEKAIAQNRRASGNMTVFFMKDVSDFCMGMQSITMTLNAKEKERNALHKKLANMDSEISELNDEIKELRGIVEELGKEIDFDVYEDLTRISIDIASQTNRIRQAQEAVEEDSQYVRTLAQLNEVEARKREVEGTVSELGRQIGRLESQIERAQKDIDEALVQSTDRDEKLRLSKENHPDEALVAESEYAKYLEDVAAGRNARPFVLTEGLSKKKDEAYRDLMALESSHHAAFKNFECTVEEDKLRESLKRLDEIEVRDLEIAKNKLSEQQANLETIFKNEIVVAIYENVNAGKRRLRVMNSSLKRMSFETEYQFVTKDICDGSDYEIIMQYAQYLQAEQNALGLFEKVSEYEFNKDATEQMMTDIQGVLDRISSNDTDVDYLNGLADYRNYMTYDIRTEAKATGQVGLLSKDSGYNSGAGAQIPYTVILTVALVMEYNRDPSKSTVRIMFMDEPFEKMSSNNVKKMIDFFREQNLQVIFCGASKMDCIGENCGAIIPVLKKDRCHMTIGSVNYKRTA